MNAANTPAAGAEGAAAAEPAVPAHVSLSAILSGYSPEAETATEQPAEGAEQAAEEVAEGASESDEATKEADAAKKTEKTEKKPFNEADLFTDEALSKPEGIAAAREFLRKRNAKVTRREMAANRRHEGLEGKATELTQTLESARALKSQLVTDLRAFRARGLPARDRIEALGRLAGEDGLQVLEALNVELANAQGKQQKTDPEVAELRAELADLKNLLRQGKQRADEAQTHQRVQQIRMGLVGQAKAAAEAYPHLAQFASDEPETLAEAIGHMKESHHAEHGTVLDDRKMFGMLEEHLAHLRGGPPAAATPNAGAGQVTGAGTQPANPGSGRGARPPNGKTISPGLATQSSGAQRSLTDEEIIESAAKDEDWLGSLFPNRRRK